MSIFFPREGPKQKTALAQLAILNAEVTAIITKRKAFMDENQHLFAEFQVGDEIVNVMTGEHGVVSKHYRYWDTQSNPIHDSNFSVEHEIRVASNIFDNTSRHDGFHPWIRLADYEKKTSRYVDALRMAATR